MNKVILMGRLTRDPEVRYSQGQQAMAIARYTFQVSIQKNGKISHSFCLQLSKQHHFLVAPTTEVACSLILT